MKIIKGITLVEVMITLLISTLLLSVIIAIYIAANRNFYLQQGLSHIQENARITTSLLMTDLRMAGYIGCPRLTNDFPLFNTTSFLLTKQNKITSSQYEYGITVRHADILHANLIKMPNKNEIVVTNTSLFHTRDILIISDCNRAEIFIVKHVLYQGNQQKIITTVPFRFDYAPFAEVSHLIQNDFFIKKTKRQHNSRYISALFVRDINRQVIELVEDVEDFTIDYYCLENGLLIPRKTLTNASNLKGISIKLHFSSGENLIPINKMWYIYVAI